MRASLRLKVFVAFAVMCLAGPSDANAYLGFENDLPVPNGAYAIGAAQTPRPCITCHNNPDGGNACGSAPCLNPFGISVRPAVMSGDASAIWTPAIAGADADGDGFTNGQELQDPGGLWEPNTSRPGTAAYVTRPGFPDDSPGLHDADGDRYCWFGRDLDMNGTCTGSGEQSGGFDCDDAVGATHSGATEICTDSADNDCDGFPTLTDSMCSTIVDRDGDHFCPFGIDANHNGSCLDQGEGTPLLKQDCDDDSNTRYPNAPENCTDMVDGNCNCPEGGCVGDPDAVDSECTGDHDDDHDGYCPIGQDFNMNFNCLDPGENTAVSDCNDDVPTVHPNAPELCGDAADNDCDGNADFTDSECASVADADGDGVCPIGQDLDDDGSCIDTVPVNEANGQSDCDDSDPAISSLAIEICTDAIDQDCDGHVALTDPDCVRYLDTDQDHYCPVGQDKTPYNGHCADPGETNALADCDDGNINISPAQTEATALCLNGKDDDCNERTDSNDPACIEYKDQDLDGYCTIGHDLNGDHGCDDPGEQTSDSDSRPTDPTVFPGAPENCFDHKDNDQDGTADFQGEGVLPMDPKCRQDIDVDNDGACPVGRDVNDDGDCMDTGENYRESDCNDGNSAISPKATEDYIPGVLRALQPCFDFKDNDCDANVDLSDVGCFYVYDDDNDGFCRHGIDDTNDGDCLDASEDRGGLDCDDSDPDVRPGANEICDDAIDNDCDTFLDGDDATCECGVAADCEAMTCKTATCNAGVCAYTDVEHCKGGGKCVAAPESGRTGALPFVTILGLTLTAVGLRRRMRRGALDVSDSRRMS